MTTSEAAASTQSAGPLAGVRVLELGAFIAGPFAGQLLGDYGAEVIKIEQAGVGDPMRHWGLVHEGESLWWPAIARNKRSITVDLRTSDGQDLARQLIAQCDVVLENFRPGTLHGWGLGYDVLQSVNPRVILAHISGFGQTGPAAGQAGFGSVAEAVGGIRFTTGEPDRESSRAGISLGDSLGSLFTVIGITTALHERSQSGRGQEIDVAISEAVLAVMESLLPDYSVGGKIRRRTGSTLPGVAPSNAYPTSDGHSVVIAGNADGVFRRLTEAMGRRDLATDDRFASHVARGANQELLDDIISDWSRAIRSDELLTLMDTHGVPAGRINDAPAILADPQFMARDMVVWQESTGGTRLPMTGVVPRFSRTPGSIRNVGPALGADTDDVLTGVLGLSTDEVDELRHKQIV